MLRLNGLITVLALSLSLGVFASDFSGFNKRFKLVKDSTDNVVYVQMNLMQNRISLTPYLKQLKDDVVREISRMRSKSYQNEMAEFAQYLRDHSDFKSEEQAENIYVVMKSLENLKEVEVERFFKDVKTKNVLAYFKAELQKAFDKYSLFNIAATEDPRYFYKRNVTYEVVKKALDFAKKKFGEVPLLNMASFVIVKVHDMMLEQRLFHQNMLLHYLQNTDPSELGLTMKEADKIFSSIYESRIGYLNLPESNRAVESWSKYGLDKFYSMVRQANNRLRRSNRTLDEVGSRYNFAFFEAKEDGKRVVKNLVHNKHKFSKKMATAFYIDEPGKVRRFRSLLNLSQFGLSFITLPNWLKSQVTSFIDSYYKEQQILEGALIGHFEMNSDSKMATQIRSQIINPYIMF